MFRNVKYITSIILFLALLMIACVREEPEAVNIESGDLESQFINNLILLDTTQLLFEEKVGSDYHFTIIDPSLKISDKDILIYHNLNTALSGQVVSVLITGSSLHVTLNPVKLNDIISVLSMQDTVNVQIQAKLMEVMEAAEINGDQLVILSSNLITKTSSNLFGVLTIDSLMIRTNSQFITGYYMGSIWSDGIKTKRIDQLLVQNFEFAGQIGFNASTKNLLFQDSVLLRRYVSGPHFDHGYPVFYKVEDYLLFEYLMNEPTQLNVAFDISGVINLQSLYTDRYGWVVKPNLDISNENLELTGWGQLRQNSLRLALKTSLTPIFAGLEGPISSFIIGLDVETNFESPNWESSGYFSGLGMVELHNGPFADLLPGTSRAVEYTSQVFNNSGNLENEAPIAIFSVAPPIGFTNTEFIFDARESSDREDETSKLQVRWDFTNDGIWDTSFDELKTISHNYSVTGSFTCKLEVRDLQGLTNTTSKVVQVKETSSAPIAAFTISPESGRTSDIYTFDASGCFDFEDPLSLLKVRWDFDNDGIWETQFSPNKAAFYVYQEAGNYVVKLEVKDTDGLTGSTTKLLRVTSANIKPTALFTVTPQSGQIGTVFSFDASSSTDPEDATELLEVRWDWENDGIWDTEYRTIKTVTHSYDIAGSYTVVLEVKDTEGFASTATITIEVRNLNTPPTADFTFTPANGTIDTDFIFDASVSSDQQDNINQLQCRWDWNNDDIYDTEYSFDKVNVKSFSTTGSIIVKVQVKDSGGLTATRARIVQIN